MLGKVGIGTKAPLGKLDVVGGAARTGTAPTTPSFYVTGTLTSGLTGPAANNIEFRNDSQDLGIGFGYQTIYAVGIPNQSLNLSSRGNGPITLNGYDGYTMGNVGIGTLSPMAKLHVAGTSKFGGIINTDNNWISGDGGAEGIYVSDSGSVGIGTTNPGAKLEVNGSMIIQTNLNPYLRMKNVAGDTIAYVGDNDKLFIFGGDYVDDSNMVYLPSPMKFRVGSGTLSVNEVAGKVGIGTLAGSGNRLVYSDSSGTLTNSSSDLRLKKDIETLSGEIDVLGALSKLRGVYYNWNTDVEAAKNLGNQREIGMIAQEVEQVLPELVGTNANGYKSLDYVKFFAFLLEAVKVQQKEIQDLKQEVSKLKGNL